MRYLTAGIDMLTASYIIHSIVEIIGEVDNKF